MNFKELSKATQEHRTDYFALLLTHHREIIREVGKTSKQAVSNALHINPSQFSGVYACIVAYSELVNKGLDHADSTYK